MKKIFLAGILFAAVSSAVFPQAPARPPAPPPPLTLAVWPQLSLPSPVDSNASLFGVGAGARIAGEYFLPFNPLFFANASLDYGFSPLAIGGSGLSLSLFSVSAGVGIQYPVVSWLSLRALATAGYYLGLENSTGLSHASGNGFMAAGLGANFDFGWPVVLGTEVSYRLYASLMQAIDMSVGVTYSFGPPTVTPSTTVEKPRPQPAQPVQPPPKQPQPVPARPAPLKAEPPVEEQGMGLLIKGVAFDNVFPIFQPYYDDHPIGRFTLKNTEKVPATAVTVSFVVKEYMDAPKKCVTLPELKAGETRNVDLYALFKATILDITEPTKVAAEISVSYTLAGRPGLQSESATLRIFDRNAHDVGRQPESRGVRNGQGARRPHLLEQRQRRYQGEAQPGRGPESADGDRAPRRPAPLRNQLRLQPAHVLRRGLE